MSKDKGESTLPKCFIKHRLDEIDIYILNKLHDKTYGWDRRKVESLSPDDMKFWEEYKAKPWKRQGASLSTLNEDIRHELKIDITRTEVEKRVERLVREGVITSLHSVVINPQSLYDHVFYAFWKIPLSQTIRPYGWWDISNLWDVDKTEKDSKGKVLDIVRTLMVPEGTGQYDFISLVYTNDLGRHSTLLERLQSKGLLVSSTTQRVWEPTGMFFDPVKIPDYDSYIEAFERHQPRVSKMHETRLRVNKAAKQG